VVLGGSGVQKQAFEVVVVNSPKKTQS